MSNEAQQIQSYSLPWDRFWARCIDLTLQMGISLLVYLVIYFSSDIINPSFTNLLNQSGKINFKIWLIIWVTVSVVFILYETIFLSVFATTLGKALFNIRVTEINGEKLSFNGALIRAISFYWFALYFLVFATFGPIVGFWFSSRYYKKTGTFRWDKFSGSIVNQLPLTVCRRNIAVCLAVSCIILWLIDQSVFLHKIM